MEEEKLNIHAVMCRFYFSIGRYKADSEKAVLPTIIFISTNHEEFADLRRRGFGLCFGWWDFAVKFWVIF
jgi:hypothetical protein